MEKESLELLLDYAHQVVQWTAQSTLNPESAAYPHLVKARQRYYKARIDFLATDRPLSVQDTGGCTCRWGAEKKHKVSKDCMYHYAASVQPWNHRIPWNCPAYYDGCNCEGGPRYDRPE